MFMFKNLFAKKEIKSHSTFSTKSYFKNVGQPVWTDRNYVQLSEEAYVKNVIANRCISMIAKGGSCINFQVKDKKLNKILEKHELINLLNKPNPLTNRIDFFETIFSHKLIAGNVFIQAIFPSDRKFKHPLELYTLRPDRVSVLTSDNVIPCGYKYKISSHEKFFSISPIDGKSEILHIKNFHPTNDWYGLSQIEAGAYAIDQHNEASKWNQAMLQNGARPCGALIVKNENNDGFLTEEQFNRLKNQFNEEFTGSNNVGKPLLLEGGIEWKEMSLTPKDMDFVNIKYNSAREIALAFGVPSQLLGIPGDNTYNNLSEARLFLWEQTILPMVDNVLSSLNNWLCEMYEDNLEITYDKNSIVQLAPRRAEFFNMVNNANFLSDEEKKKILNIVI